MAWTLLIRNGTVVDGSGARGYAADVAVEGDRIVAIERRLVGEARRTIDAAGFTVAPGFIDIHSHSHLFYLGCPPAEAHLRQGGATAGGGGRGGRSASIGSGGGGRTPPSTSSTSSATGRCAWAPSARRTAP